MKLAEITNIKSLLEMPQRINPLAVKNTKLYANLYVEIFNPDNASKFNIKKLYNISPSIILYHISNTSEGIPLKVYFENIIPTFHTLLCDHSYTDDGERFFKNKVIPTAFGQNLKVYFYHTKQKKIIHIATIQEYLELEHTQDVWSPDRHENFSGYMDKRFIISDTIL